MPSTRANAQGFDLNGTKGADIFSPLRPRAGLARPPPCRSSSPIPSLIAASSDGTPGSNGNLTNLSDVATQKVANGQTPIDFYSNLVFQAGNATSNTSADVDASTQILQQLQDQRGSISGVSLDEEAANIIQYQTAYQAAARVVSTVNALLADAVNLGLGAAVQ